MHVWPLNQDQSLFRFQTLCSPRRQHPVYSSDTTVSPERCRRLKRERKWNLRRESKMTRSFQDSNNYWTRMHKCDVVSMVSLGVFFMLACSARICKLLAFGILQNLPWHQWRCNNSYIHNDILVINLLLKYITNTRSVEVFLLEILSSQGLQNLTPVDLHQKQEFSCAQCGTLTYHV